MLIAIMSRNPMLIRSIDLMLSAASIEMRTMSVSGELPDMPSTAEGLRADVVLLDGDLPASRRAEALRAARDLPVIVVASPEVASGDLHGMEETDLLVTPLNQRDLVARITAAAAAHRSRRDRKVSAGRLVLDLAVRQASIDGVALPLTGKEYEVLEYLALRKGVTLTKEMFLDRLYGGIDEPEVKIIDVFVCKIRRKIRELTGGETLIETVWGRGYVLNDPDAPEMADATGEGDGKEPGASLAEGSRKPRSAAG